MGVNGDSATPDMAVLGTLNLTLRYLSGSFPVKIGAERGKSMMGILIDQDRSITRKDEYTRFYNELLT
jgi:hypothetical protein